MQAVQKLLVAFECHDSCATPPWIVMILGEMPRLNEVEGTFKVITHSQELHELGGLEPVKLSAEVDC